MGEQSRENYGQHHIHISGERAGKSNYYMESIDASGDASSRVPHLQAGRGALGYLKYKNKLTGVELKESMPSTLQTLGDLSTHERTYMQRPGNSMRRQSLTSAPPPPAPEPVHADEQPKTEEPQLEQKNAEQRRSKINRYKMAEKMLSE